MKRKLLTVFISLIMIQFIMGNEDKLPLDDDLSRLILLNFHYFSPPYSLPDLDLTNPEGEFFHVGHNRGQAIILIFLGDNDPFNNEIRDQINELKTRYTDEPLLFLTVSSQQNEYQDRFGYSRDKLGVKEYPSYFIIDHNYNLRGSAEGIYPSLISEDFIKILDKLLLDIKSPGIINTLE